MCFVIMAAEMRFPMNFWVSYRRMLAIPGSDCCETLG